MGNLDDLPDLLLHPSNLRLVQRFVREWQRWVSISELIRFTNVSSHNINLNAKF